MTCGIEWRLAFLIILASVSDRVRAGVNGPRGSNVQFRLSHLVILASAIALAPYWACLGVGLAYAAALWILFRRSEAEEADRSVRTAGSETTQDEPDFFIDPTTGLASRRYVEMFLPREVSRSERLGKPVSVAVFDLDGFSALVDSVGQDAIDKALSEIGTALKAGLREYDVVGRYSSGRLIAVLPESSAEQAFEAAERLHGSLASSRLGNKPLSVSVGIAAYPDDVATPDELVNSAHCALNRGRIDGPNGVFRYQGFEQAA